MAPSGAGKTTLLRLLLGLEAPSVGEVTRSLRPEQLSVVFQEDSLFPWLDVLENVTLLNRLTNKPVDQSRLQEYLERLDLAAFRSHMPRSLSTGMRQKVSLCRSLVFQPRLYAIDEGLANIDDEQRYVICSMLRNEVMCNGSSVLLITHTRSDCLLLCDEVIIGSPRPLAVVGQYCNSLPTTCPGDFRFTPAFRAAMEELGRVQSSY